jgi:hypothetical protein
VAAAPSVQTTPPIHWAETPRSLLNQACLATMQRNRRQVLVDSVRLIRSVRSFVDCFKIPGNTANNNAPKPGLFGQPAQPAQNAFGGNNIFGNSQPQAPAQQQSSFGFNTNNNAQQQQQPANPSPRKFLSLDSDLSR